MSPLEVQEKLMLTKLKDHFWYVWPSCAITGDGLFEWFSWLTSNSETAY